MIEFFFDADQETAAAMIPADAILPALGVVQDDDEELKEVRPGRDPAPVTKNHEDEDEDDEVVDFTESRRRIAMRIAAKGLHVKQTAKTERQLARDLAIHFKSTVEATAKRIRATDRNVEPDGAKQQAASIMDEVWGEDVQQQFDEQLVTAAWPTLAATVIQGAQAEQALTDRINKLTTAEEIAERLGLEIPEELSLSAPEWMIEAAQEEIADTFQQPYWLNINRATRFDIERTLASSIGDGLSIRKIADRIIESHGTAYSRAKATIVARTEVTNALNSGHARSIQETERETGIQMGKEWLSVLGTTTRDSHANLDGTVVGSKDSFELGGVQVPWPGHFSLPASERINCQCTVISAIAVDELDVDGEDAR
jgi:hypothetical protein